MFTMTRGLHHLTVVLLAFGGLRANAQSLSEVQCEAVKKQIERIEVDAKSALNVERWNTELRADYTKVKNQVLDETAWARSDAASLPTVLRQLTQSVLGMAQMLGGASGTIVATASTLAEGVISDVRSGKEVSLILTALLGRLLREAITDSLITKLGAEKGALAGAALLLREKADGIDSIASEVSDREELRKTVRDQIAKIDAALSGVDCVIAEAQLHRRVAARAIGALREVQQRGCTAELVFEGTWTGKCDWHDPRVDDRVTLTLEGRAVPSAGLHVSSYGARSSLRELTYNASTRTISFRLFGFPYTGSVAKLGGRRWEIRVTSPLAIYSDGRHQADPEIVCYYEKNNSVQ